MPVASCTAVGGTAGNSWTATTCPPRSRPARPRCRPARRWPRPPATTTWRRRVRPRRRPTSRCRRARRRRLRRATTGPTRPAPRPRPRPCPRRCARRGPRPPATTGPTTIVLARTPPRTCRWRIVLASAATAGNAWVTTTCPAPVTTGPTPVQTCTVVAASSGNSYVATTCAVATTGRRASRVARPATANGRQQLDDTTCNSVTTTNVPVQTCARCGRGFRQRLDDDDLLARTTPRTSQSPRARASAATPATTGRRRPARRPPSSSVPTPVQTCTPVAPNAGNGYTQTLCTSSVNSQTTELHAAGAERRQQLDDDHLQPGQRDGAGAELHAAVGNAGNSWTTITCWHEHHGSHADPRLCSRGGDDRVNSWTTDHLPAATRRVRRRLQTCSAVAADREATTGRPPRCPTVSTGPTGVQTCAPIRRARATTGRPRPAARDEQQCSGRDLHARRGARRATAGRHQLPCAERHRQRAGGELLAARPRRGQQLDHGSCPAPITTTNVPVQTCAARRGERRQQLREHDVHDGRPSAGRRADLLADRRERAATTGPPRRARSNNTGADARADLHAADRERGQQLGRHHLHARTTRSNMPVVVVHGIRSERGQRWTTTSCPPRTTTNVPVPTLQRPGGRGRQQLDDHDLHDEQRGERAGAVVHAGGRVGGQQLDQHHLRHEQHVERRRAGVHRARRPSAGNNWTDGHVPGTDLDRSDAPSPSCTPVIGDRGERLDDDDVHHRHERDHGRAELHGAGRERGQQLHRDRSARRWRQEDPVRDDDDGHEHADVSGGITGGRPTITTTRRVRPPISTASAMRRAASPRCHRRIRRRPASPRAAWRRRRARAGRARRRKVARRRAQHRTRWPTSRSTTT